MNVLVTGGAGYIGTSLLPLLLAKGHNVTVFDSLLHGGDALLPFFNYHFEFIHGDVRDKAKVEEACKGQDAVIHLAALVGAPACSKNPIETHAVNVQGTANVYAASMGKLLLYASTVSVYGSSENLACDESSKVNPLSEYGQTKFLAEDIMMSTRRCTAFRLATAFGVSPRMRFDLLINDLTYQAVKNRSAVVYEADFIRPFAHVKDIARGFAYALENPIMGGQIYNLVGFNCTKRQVCEEIKKQTGAYIHYAEVGKDADARNYAVSSDKLGRRIQPEVSLARGVEELVRALPVVKVNNHYSNV